MNRQLFPILLPLLFFTACDDIFVEDISKDKVNIIAPKNDVILENENTTLVWDVLDGADEYHVIVVSPSFSDIRAYICDSITDDYKMKLSLHNGAYEWSVQACNSAYVSLKNYETFQIATP